ncbi:MAG: Asparagine synthetase (glutamine-hydrolyzing) 1 [Pelotomaculum sp. PtaU1.Bin065]|nr:MAG: Asparagine synthetase (glutamine-hydrolyzing) 1 [Pelotomaculum sp. PtaU1.Bin065]
MCGIYGVYNFGEKKEIIRAKLKEMGERLSHRGPDDEGLFVSDRIALGQRRLSIIDISTGHQPMGNEDSSLWIAYNGEVYNYIELRQTYLEGKHRFVSKSDTEVIVHLFEEFGLDGFSKLNGMFAFALWDQKRQRLCLVRDPVGIKPLFYTIFDGHLVFASEIKSILAYLEHSPVPNEKAISEYLAFGYAMGPETMFKGIFRLPPGHFLLCDANGCRVKQYWDLRFNPDQSLPEREYVEKFKSLFKESVKLQLRSDVPLGVFLSGGIDSSSVVAMVSSLIKDEIKTFSAVFNNVSGYSEAKYSRLVSRQFHTKHFEVDVSPDDFRAFIPQFIWHLEEPTTDPSGIPLYYVSRLARQQVKVVLSGEGSDEMLAGYTIYRYMKLMELYRRVPVHLRRAIFDPMLRAFAGKLKAGRFLSSAALPIEKRYYGLRYHDISAINGIISDEYIERLGIAASLDNFARLYDQVNGQDIINKLLYVDTKVWLPEDILIKSDRMSMATSIELRVPFLDKNIIEFSARIPPSLKMKGLTGKYILKQAVRGMVPEEIINRKKTGFPVPIAEMMRKELKDYIHDVLLDSKAAGRGYFNSNRVKILLEEHLNLKADNHKVLWMLFVLELWHKRFIDRS